MKSYEQGSDSVCLSRSYGSVEFSGERRFSEVGRVSIGAMDSLEQGTTQRSKRVGIILGLTCVAAIAGTAALGGGSSGGLQPHPRGYTTFTTSFSARDQANANQGLNPLAFTASNLYQARDGKPGADYPWLKNTQLVEPFRNTTLSVVQKNDEMAYRWTVTPCLGSAESVEVLGDTANVIFASLGEHKVLLEEYSKAGLVTRSVEEVVMCKYVRREIRTLFEEERQDLFDAMLTMWEFGTKEGRGVFGDEYLGALDLGRLHFAAGGDIDCDHFHHGLGFLTSHVLMTNVFEYSLQLVNPKLSLPYWDFTIETSRHPDEDLKDISPLFQESWFGSADEFDMQVKNGRWGHFEVPKMSEVMRERGFSNVYGKLRAPWNTNNRMYLTRGFGEFCGGVSTSALPLPTCKEHYSLTTDYDTFYGWSWYAMFDPHGPIHLYIGGLLDCQKVYHDVEKIVGRETATTLRALAIYHRKSLFRAGYLTCQDGAPKSLDHTELFEQGYCGCLNHDLEAGDDYKEVLSVMSLAETILAGFGEDSQREVARLLCNNPINDGDQVQASSPLDPTFWPSHPTMERLFMFKSLTGTMTDMTWPDKPVTYTDECGETHTIVVSSDASGMCLGHSGSDVFPFGLRGDDDESLPVRLWGEKTRDEISNREVLKAMDPRSNALPYIYDTFDWPHCREQGYDLSDAWSTAGRGRGAMAAAATVVDQSSRQSPRPPGVKPLGNSGDNYAIFGQEGMLFPPYQSLRDLREWNAG